jgi:hypothetical protein
MTVDATDTGPQAITFNGIQVRYRGSSTRVPLTSVVINKDGHSVYPTLLVLAAP